MELHLLVIFAVLAVFIVLSVFARERARGLLGVQQRVTQHYAELDRQRKIEQALAAAHLNE